MSRPDVFGFILVQHALERLRRAWLAKNILPIVPSVDHVIPPATYLNFIASDRVARREMTAKQLSRGWCLGGSEFKAQMRAAVRKENAGFERERFFGLECDDLRRERELVWDERLHVLAGKTGIVLRALPKKKSHSDKLLLAAAMKSLTSVSNAWLAQSLEMGSPKSVSQLLHRWRQQESSRQALKRLLSNVQT